MKHWMTYVKASYEVIMEAEDRAHITLPHEHEAFLVHTFARYMEQPNIPTDAIAIKLMETMNAQGDRRKTGFQQIAEECVLIQGLGLNQRSWPSPCYFNDMGQLALEYRAYSQRPPELYYEALAHSLPDFVRVLRHVRSRV
jgi:hypothetical protein